MQKTIKLFGRSFKKFSLKGPANFETADEYTWLIVAVEQPDMPDASEPLFSHSMVFSPCRVGRFLDVLVLPARVRRFHAREASDSLSEKKIA